MGWTFRDWFAFSVDKKTGAIGISKSPKAKLPNLIKAALDPDGQKVIDNGTFEPGMLMDKEIRAKCVRSGKNEDGDHTRIKAESMMKKPKTSKKDRDLEDIDVENLDIPEPPNWDVAETG